MNQKYDKCLENQRKKKLFISSADLLLLSFYDIYFSTGYHLNTNSFIAHMYSFSAR